MPYEQERSPKIERRDSSTENPTPLDRRDLEVEDQHEIEGVGLGLVLEEVGADELDVEPLSSGSLARFGDRDLGEVDSGNLPAELGEPARRSGPRRRRDRAPVPASRSATSATRKRFGVALQRRPASAYLRSQCSRRTRSYPSGDAVRSGEREGAKPGADDVGDGISVRVGERTTG